LCSCLFFFFFFLIAILLTVRHILLASALVAVIAQILGEDEDGEDQEGRRPDLKKEKKASPFGKFDEIWPFNPVVEDFLTACGTCRTIPELCKSVMAKYQQKSLDQQK